MRALSRELERLRERVDDLEDLRDLNAAVARNRGKPAIAWEKARSSLGLD